MKENLLYITLFGECYFQYFSLFYQSLYRYTNTEKFELLIITDEKTKEQMLLKDCQNQFNFFIVNNINPYFCRYYIFNWKNIYNYKKAFYIDIDVIFYKSIIPIFDALTKENTFVVKSVPHTSSFISNFGGDYINTEQLIEIQKLGYKPINSGQFLFFINNTNEIKFNEIYNDCINNNYNINRLNDQIYFNLYILKNKLLVDYNILEKTCHLRLMFLDKYRFQKENDDTVFTHFAGYYKDKYNFLLDTFLSFSL